MEIFARKMLPRLGHLAPGSEDAGGRILLF
jgi:hypothetical protein